MLTSDEAARLLGLPSGKREFLAPLKIRGERQLSFGQWRYPLAAVRKVRYDMALEVPPLSDAAKEQK
jgi:hypothetical protein